MWSLQISSVHWRRFTSWLNQKHFHLSVHQLFCCPYYNVTVWLICVIARDNEDVDFLYCLYHLLFSRKETSQFWLTLTKMSCKRTSQSLFTLLLSANSLLLLRISSTLGQGRLFLMFYWNDAANVCINCKWSFVFRFEFFRFFGYSFVRNHCANNF